MKDKMKNMLAAKIVNVACSTVENTVGKSVPLCSHEVKVPECIKKEYLNK